MNNAGTLKVTTPSEREIVMTRVFAAPRRLIAWWASWGWRRGVITYATAPSRLTGARAHRTKSPVTRVAARL